MGRIRPSRFIAALVAAVLISAGGAVAAHADQVVGDGVAPIDNTGQAASVEMCSGEAAQSTVLIAARRNGNPSGSANGNFVFKNGSTLTVQVGTTSPGVSASLATNTISIPSGWEAMNNGFSAVLTAVVSVSAKTVSGSGAVPFTYTGTKSDGTGVTGTVSVPVAWTVEDCDTAAPTLRLPDDITTEATGPGGANVEYEATADDENLSTFGCTPSSGSLFGLDTTTVSCTAMDAGGRTTTGSFTITVEDTTAPAVNSVTNITTEATAAGTVVEWPTPDATDVVDGPREVTCVPASGSLFGVGTTSVACEAVDASDNTGFSNFTVTITDTTAPTLQLPANITAEAAGPDGATVTFFTSASDLVDGAVTVDCIPASGSLFPLTPTPTTVDCSATDKAGRQSTGSFTVTVRDTIAPEVTVPEDQVIEADRPGGAIVNFEATATDAVSGSLNPVCSPASETIFPLGLTTVKCSATDGAGNKRTAEFDVTVQDTTPPSLTVPTGTIYVEATGADGAKLPPYTVTATDAVDEDVEVTCTIEAGTLLEFGSHQVTCTATDDFDNEVQKAFPVVVRDTTAPVVKAPDDVTKEATGPGGAAVTFGAATATDAVTTDVVASCDRDSGSTFALGNTTVTCTAEDEAGNIGSDTFTVSVVDTTAPAITVPADIVSGATGPAGAAVGYTVTAHDLVDGNVPVTCTPPSGSTFAPGTKTVECTATDQRGHSASKSFTVTVQYSLLGFYQPVDMNGVWNVVKGGSTVPLKFEVFAGTTELTSTSVVSTFTSKTVGCGTSNALADEIELLTTGGTSLRYDTTGGQFIQNWQTPKKPGECYQVTMTTTGGASLIAFFKLK